MESEQSKDLDRALEVVTDHTALTSVRISPAGAQHFVAWDTDRRVRVLHEAGLWW